MPRILLSLCLILGLASPVSAGGAGVGYPAPELDTKARTASGKELKMKSLKGGWVVVTFGAHWCKPCKKELPAWDKLAKQYQGKATFIAVNISNKKKDGEKFMKGLKIKNMVVVYSPQSSTNTANNWVGGDDDGEEPTFPTTFIVDPKGIIRHVHPGFHKGDDKKLAKQLDKLIAAAKSAKK